MLLSCLRDFSLHVFCSLCAVFASLLLYCYLFVVCSAFFCSLFSVHSSCVCSLLFFFLLACLLSCVLVVAALVVRVFCVQQTNFRFTVTKVSSERDKGHSRQAGMSEKLGSLFCVVKNNGIISRHGSKLYYYNGQEPEKKKTPPPGTPMCEATESFC